MASLGIYNKHISAGNRVRTIIRVRLWLCILNPSSTAWLDLSWLLAQTLHHIFIHMSFFKRGQLLMAKQHFVTMLFYLVNNRHSLRTSLPSGNFVRDTEMELCFGFYWKLRNRSVLEIYKLIWAGLILTVSSTLAKSHQHTTDVYDLQPMKSSTQFSAIFLFAYMFLY